MPLMWTRILYVKWNAERQVSITVIKSLAEILEHDWKVLQMIYISYKIKIDF